MKRIYLLYPPFDPTKEGVRYGKADQKKKEKESETSKGLKKLQLKPLGPRNKQSYKRPWMRPVQLITAMV